MARKTKDNDWGLILKLVPYAKQNYKILLTALLLLIPLSFAGAIQPLLVGQAISLLRGNQLGPF